MFWIVFHYKHVLIFQSPLHEKCKIDLTKSKKKIREKLYYLVLEAALRSLSSSEDSSGSDSEHQLLSVLRCEIV